MLKKSPSARNDINNSLNVIVNYTYPILRESKKGWYIEFYVHDPLQNKLRRKRITVAKAQTVKARREYAQGLIFRLTQQL